MQISGGEVIPFDKGETNAWREDSIIAKALKNCLDDYQANCKWPPQFCQGFSEAFPEVFETSLEMLPK